jgi:formylglycine-generating enzyme required for sulfatase activity
MADFDGGDPYGGEVKEGRRKQTVSVGMFRPNAWGLYDMHGNVWEWCRDWRGDYPVGEVADPLGPSEGERRMARGGAWDEFAVRCRSAVRGMALPEYQGNHIGFRLALVPVKNKGSGEP